MEQNEQCEKDETIEILEPEKTHNKRKGYDDDDDNNDDDGENKRIKKRRINSTINVTPSLITNLKTPSTVGEFLTMINQSVLTSQELTNKINQNKQSHPVKKSTLLIKDKPQQKTSPSKKPVLTPVNNSENITRFMTPIKKNKITPFNKIEYTEKSWLALHYILTWINYRLIDKSFHKEFSGLYLWSSNCSVGKTLLCNVLSKIFRMYWWEFEDSDWQQSWNNGYNYECIVYNAVNSSSLLKFRQIELHGDRKEIAISKRNQKICDHIKKDMPYIITSNLPMVNLGYDKSGYEIMVWEARMISVNLTDIPLMDLINKIIREYNVILDKEDDPPADIGCRHI